MATVTMKQLLEAGVHFGHQTSKWNPKMKTYIFGARNGIHIIDLQQTVGLFRNAYNFLVETVASGKPIMFVGTKRQAQEAIREEAERCGMFYVVNRWLGGLMTNFQTVRKSIDRMKSLESMRSDGSMENFKKKEILGFEREIEKKNFIFNGIRDMRDVPGALFIIDPRKEKIAINEAAKLGIPTVALVDTNCDPNCVDYVIPSNDDAIRAIKLFCSQVAEAALEGTRLRQERIKAQAVQAAATAATAAKEEADAE